MEMNEMIYHVPAAAISTKEIYPHGYEVPKGYKVIDFRPPKHHEIALTANASGVGRFFAAPYDYGSSLPRIILKKKVEPLYEYLGYRTPVEGEYYFSNSADGIRKCNPSIYYGYFGCFKCVNESEL